MYYTEIDGVLYLVKPQNDQDTEEFFKAVEEARNDFD